MAPRQNLWAVKIDPSQVDQTMANLAVNSRDAISDVGKLTIETKNTVVDDDYSWALTKMYLEIAILQLRQIRNIAWE